MHLWDKTTNNLTDFFTHFSFVINSRGGSFYGDGLAFFLAPAGYNMPSATEGGAMGLPLVNQSLNSTEYPFVAVEFDIYKNPWDTLPGEHVGVDINSMASVATVTWQPNIRDGKLNDAEISYSSSSMNLSIVFTGFIDGTNNTVQQHLNHVVDLRRYLPEWVDFGFTAATGDSFAIHTINSWDFISTLEIQEHTQKAAAGSKTGRAVGLGVGGIVLIGVLALISYGLRKRWKKNKQGETESDEELGKETAPQKFSYAELASAAKNFRNDQKLGKGGFGDVYEGILKDSKTRVAIKRISENSRQGIKEFKSEVKIISQLRHRNLVQLIGWCREGKELLLVYDFMPNRSLDCHLFKGQSLLTWGVRYNITLDLASALLYLHEECVQCVLHRDIKSSNIMLDQNFTAKLGDFGLARLVDHSKGSLTTTQGGTRGYMAPECASGARKPSKESDVYSFGIVVLEIACGRKPINSDNPENEKKLVEWVWELHGNGRILDAADPRLEGYFEQREMKCLMTVGLLCAHPDPGRRPSIERALRMLKFEAPLQDLPPSMPVLTYL